eukprot:2689435-Rhodomonas_salina.2
MDRCNRSSQWKLQVIYHDDYSYFTGAGSLVLDTRVPVNVSQDGAMGGALTPVRIATLLLVPPVELRRLELAGSWPPLNRS